MASLMPLMVRSSHDNNYCFPRQLPPGQTVVLVSLRVMRGQSTEDKVKTLEVKVEKAKQLNSKLSDQARAHRNVVTSLEETIASHEERWKDFHSTLLCVNRFWELLHFDIAMLRERSTRPEPHDEVQAPASGLHTSASGSFSWDDPFVAALIAEWEDTKDEGDVMTHMSKADRMLNDVERSLARRANETKSMMADLLEEIRGIEAGAKPAGPGERDEIAVDLKLLVEKEKACSRALLERTRTAEDKLMQSNHELQEAKNELADKQGQLERVEKKLLALQREAAREPENAEHCLPPGFRPGGLEEAYAAQSTEVKQEPQDLRTTGVVKEESDGKWKQLLDEKSEEWAKEQEGYVKTEM